MLKPIDITVLGCLIASDLPKDWTQVQLAHKLGVAQSNIHRALRQLDRSRLIRGRQPRRLAAQELFVHGVRYTYPAELGAPARGLPTAHSAPVMAERVVSDVPCVWPTELAVDYGPTLPPLHPAIPRASLGDPQFYALMALIDVFRIGRVRERAAAEPLLAEMLRLETA